jgi:hypothetical protein
MSYVRNVLHYEAAQLIDGQQDTFTSVIDPNGVRTWSTNNDGSVQYQSGLHTHFVVALGSWVVSPGYMGSFPGWSGVFPAVGGFTGDGPLNNSDFTVRYGVV